jgi:hypothetical protein
MISCSGRAEVVVDRTPAGVNGRLAFGREDDLLRAESLFLIVRTWPLVVNHRDERLPLLGMRCHVIGHALSLGRSFGSTRLAAIGTRLATIADFPSHWNVFEERRDLLKTFLKAVEEVCHMMSPMALHALFESDNRDISLEKNEYLVFITCSGMVRLLLTGMILGSMPTMQGDMRLDVSKEFTTVWW